MGNIIKDITNPKILDSMQVSFLNRCPIQGRLYDEFVFYDLIDGERNYSVVIDCDWYDSEYVAFGDRSDPIFKCNDVKDLKSWLNSI